MARRPALVSDAPIDTPSRRTRSADEVIGDKAAAERPAIRTVTIHFDVAATVRWALLGIAAISAIWGTGEPTPIQEKSRSSAIEQKALGTVERLEEAAKLLITGKRQGPT